MAVNDALALTENGATIVLGEEWDKDLRAALRQVLQSMGGRVASKMPWVPDTEVMTVDIHGLTVTIEADYGHGIRASGLPQIVKEIAARVKAERKP